MSKASCGNCKHYQKTEYKDWGYCVCEIPFWAYSSCTDPDVGTKVVWNTQGHPQNFASDCDCYHGPCQACGEYDCAGQCVSG